MNHYAQQTRPPQTAERRTTARASVAYPVSLFDRRGHLLARGRTIDISQAGVFAVVVPTSKAVRAEYVVLDITVPDGKSNRSRKAEGRKVTYLARVIRHEQLGHMLGLGLEFTEKLRPDRL